MWVILSIYAVIIAGAVGLYWYTQRNNKENRPSFFTWLKSGWSPVKPAISNRSAAGNDEIGAARSEGERADAVVAVLEDIYSEFMNEVEGLRTAFEDRLASMQAAWEADRRQWQSELEALRQELAARADGAATAGAEALAERQEPTGTLSTTSSAERQNAVAEPPSASNGAVATTVGSVAEPTVASTDDLPMDPYFAILDGLQAGLSDEAMMRQLGVSKEDIQQVRQLLLTPIGDTEHSPVNG